MHHANRLSTCDDRRHPLSRDARRRRDSCVRSSETADPLTWLSPAQRERIGEPEFYEMLQGEITRRLVSLPPPTA